MTLDPIREFIASYLLWIKLGLAAAAVAGVVGLWLYHGHLVNKTRAAGYTSGYNARIAYEAAEAAKTAAVVQKRATDSAAVTQQFRNSIAKTIPAIEDATHDTQQKVVTIYRTVHEPDCVRPAGVLRELDAARARANAAATAAGG